MGISRRDFVWTTAAGTLIASAGLPTRVFAAGQTTVKIGMNIPMTGDYAPWGLPGLYGCQIVADDLNAAGTPLELNGLSVQCRAEAASIPFVDPERKRLHAM